MMIEMIAFVRIEHVGVVALGLTSCARAPAGETIAPVDEATSKDSARTTTGAAPNVSPIRAPALRPRLQTSASGCMKGAQTLGTPGVCLKIPSGYTVSRQHATDVTLEHDSAPSILLQWGNASATLLNDMRGGLEHLAAQDPDAVVGTTCDGRGAFVYAAQPGPGTRAETPEVRRALSVGRSPQGVVVRCSVEVSATDSVSRDLFEACQTLGFPKP